MNSRFQAVQFLPYMRKVVQYGAIEPVEAGRLMSNYAATGDPCQIRERLKSIAQDPANTKLVEYCISKLNQEETK